MSPLQQYTVRVLRRWPVIVVLALVGAATSAAWFFTTATTTYTATAALSTQSAERGPEQDAVLALGYVNYFNQASYQELLRRESGIPADVALTAMTGATSPILYISATGSDEQAARSAATVATDTFRNDVRESLIEERRRAAEDIQAEIDRNTAELTGPGVRQDVQVNIVLDQIRSLQGRLTDVVSDNTNHLKPLQSEPGVASSRENPLVATATGAVGGALLGVLVALLLVVTDSRVRNEVDVRHRLGVEVLEDVAGVAPAERARLVRTLVNSLRLAGHSERTVLAVVAPRGSVAARRLARELAAAGSAPRRQAVLVRADLTTPDIRPGFLDALAERAAARDALLSGPDGVLVLPVGRRTGDGAWSLVAPEQVSEIVDEVAEGSPLAVLDAPPLLEAPESQIVCAAADRVLLVLERDTTTWSDAGEALRLLGQVDATVTGIVLDEPHFDSPREVLVPRSGADEGSAETMTNVLPVVSTELVGPAQSPVPSPRPRPRPVSVGANSEDHERPAADVPDHG
ncbi:Mrp family chromosome partitioning ATPase [Pseudonocardia cypriaca]|uniref:Mrp family chromosome partitioning ATPase n=1 Tax=Pseudonocardia cypriaca TaxID=882449 RepID=A0A543GAG9_9PSEU|nr:Mrp family chromosome partitioning ATPase [Pseudonocardia cypriaca]